MVSKRFFLKAATAVVLGAVAVPSFAGEPSDPEEGQVAINYWRADGKYDKWGLHTWSRVPGGGTDQPLSGVDWFNPLKPKGKTEDGGVFWHLPLAEYAKGTVWYIIHLKDTKEQGGKDQSFDGKAHKQIWVNQGDPKMYTSKEEAIKARQAQ